MPMTLGAREELKLEIRNVYKTSERVYVNYRGYEDQYTYYDAYKTSSTAPIVFAGRLVKSKN